MTNLPSRGATAYQWLRVEGLLSPTVEPIVEAYVDGVLRTETEWDIRIRTLERQNRKLQERLNRISNAMIGNARIWELDRIAMEIGVEADIADPSLVDIDGLRADALFLRRLEWDLGTLHVAVKGDTNRRGGRYDQAEWKGSRP